LLGLLKLERQDYAVAAGNFRLAAEQGLPQAQRQLAVLLKQGRGVSVDQAEAYTWLLLSAFAAGHEAESHGANTNDLLAELEADLGSTAVERAKSKAHQLEGSVNRSRNAHGCTGWPGEFRAIPSTPPPDIQKFCR
jgi:TPR repeat protein